FEALLWRWDLHELQQFKGAVGRLRLRHGGVAAYRFDDLLLDCEQRVEGGHRVLEDHREPRAADALTLTRVHLEQVDAVYQHLTTDRRRARLHAEHRAQQRTLPGPRLTEDAYSLFHMTLHSSCGWGSLRGSSESARSF